ARRVAAEVRRGRGCGPQEVLRLRGLAFRPAAAASRREPSRGESRRCAVADGSTQKVADRGVGHGGGFPARTSAEARRSDPMSLSLELFRSAPRFLAAKAVGDRAPGLLSGPLAPLRLVNKR